MPRLTRALRNAALGALAAGLVGGTALYFGAPHPPRTPERVRDAAELDDYLARLVASGNPPGLSAAVVKDGRVAYERAFGLADGPRGVAATPDTAYHWWSMSKIPTAMDSQTSRNSNKELTLIIETSTATVCPTATKSRAARIRCSATPTATASATVWRFRLAATH